VICIKGRCRQVGHWEWSEKKQRMSEMMICEPRGPSSQLLAHSQCQPPGRSFLFSGTSTKFSRNRLKDLRLLDSTNRRHVYDFKNLDCILSEACNIRQIWQSSLCQKIPLTIFRFVIPT
jgi:hypothetical protein